LKTNNKAPDTIKNGRLEISFRLPRRPIASNRFDAAGCINRIILDNRYSFCEPEQIMVGREDAHGVGLCGEFKWDEIAGEVQPGGQFPKFGVGLLTQIPEGGCYNIRRHEAYKVDPFITKYTIDESSASFIQYAKPCLNIGAEIRRDYSLKENTLELSTSITNTESRPIRVSEYQHNFVSIQNIPIGPGYHLLLPYDRGIKKLESLVHVYADHDRKADDVLHTEGNVVSWLKSMDGLELLRLTEDGDLLQPSGPFWTLYHDDYPVSISEETSMVPEKVVYWGIEHCMCVEIYLALYVEPGKQITWQRKWTFND
jgi:hypothetical protein